MKRANTMTADWHKFILSHGWRASGYNLAQILGESIEDVERVRRSGACVKLPKGKSYSELFALWHGRPPEDHEWPVPKKIGNRQVYEWQGPELALLASLVGRLSVKEIALTLTHRLKETTQDPEAMRTPTSVQVVMNRIGLQTGDVLGGITTKAAGREIGSLAIINQAIHKKQLPATRQGRLWVIPYEAWEAWKAKRTFPPKGYVLLASIKKPLSIKSDKLSEFARMGHIPTAVRCNPYGTKGPSTQFGTWFIDKKIANQMVADRRAGRPMPWQGKPNPDNIRVTYKRWEKRKHPDSCLTCAEIWGVAGAPKSLQEYMERYPPLAHGAKRHLTRPWNPGLTVAGVAEYAKRTKHYVESAIKNGMLHFTIDGRKKYISRTDATRWIARKCPTGENEKSWLSIEAASQQYLFTLEELQSFIDQGKLPSKTGTEGAMRGLTYVSRHYCGRLRQEIGFTEAEAAQRVGVSIQRFRVLLAGVDWRKADAIPLSTVQAVIKRLQSRQGYTIEEAALKAGVSVSWVHERIQDGTIKISQVKWDRRRKYITEPMFQRLLAAKITPNAEETLGAEWLYLSEAANEAGVTATTIIRWTSDGELKSRKHKRRARYHREAVRARAREYWKTIRFHRAIPPDWLQDELTKEAA